MQRKGSCKWVDGRGSSLALYGQWRNGICAQIRELIPAQIALNIEPMCPMAGVSHAAKRYDDASCVSFMKTLKREEIYVNQCRDLEHLRGQVAAFW